MKTLSISCAAQLSEGAAHALCTPILNQSREQAFPKPFSLGAVSRHGVLLGAPILPVLASGTHISIPCNISTSSSAKCNPGYPQKLFREKGKRWLSFSSAIMVQSDLLCIVAQFLIKKFPFFQSLSLFFFFSIRCTTSASVSSALQLALHIQQRRTDNANVPACRESGHGDVNSC